MMYWSLLVPYTCVLVLIPFTLHYHDSCMRAKSFQKCPTPCDPMDCSPSDSSVHGILQAIILEWVAISFSRGSSWPRDWSWSLNFSAYFLLQWVTFILFLNLLKLIWWTSTWSILENFCMLVRRMCILFFSSETTIMYPREGLSWYLKDEKGAS